MSVRNLLLASGILLLGRNLAAAEPEKPIPEGWDYAAPMKKVAAKFRGTPGVVLHVGDSMTIANPYSQWARSGKGKTAEDVAILKWMHTGANDKTDGWWLCRTEVLHERAYTSVGGMQSTHLLNGGNRDNPPLSKMLDDFKPQVVILMVGIYDTNAGRPIKEYRANMAKAVDLILGRGAICILSTCAPLYNRLELSKQHNEALREVAWEHGLPLIDLEKEILKRRPNDWNGTLQRRNNIHLTAGEAGVSPAAAPTPENLGKSGYLLRGWLSVRKMAEVKRCVLDEQRGSAAANGELITALQKLDSRVIVLGTVRQPPLASMLSRDAQAGLRAAKRADRQVWERVRNRADWERFRDERLQALRTSLGQFPGAPKSVKVRVTGSHEGDGYRVDNLVFESRPGLVVTANLYRPAKPPKAMAGILLVHSHGQPKDTGTRQDMAMTWARAGCLVLVPDLLGHGERRQHPFRDYRQDYYFRYDLGMQLHLIGDSLMGRMIWDLARGVDVLLAQPGVDPKRIIVVSDPAGGGDIAAVATALDRRITGAVLTNFGGPQPETAYPLARDADESFEYAGSGSWESTRNLRLSARDDFLPWTIVAAAAPRRLVYNHEFYWDRENDPVWKRLQKVYGFYNAADAVAGAAGHGFVIGSPPENSHWLAINRELLYPTFERWFGIPNPKKEYSNRRPTEDLLCLTPEAIKEFRPALVHRMAAKLAAERAAAARKMRERLKPVEAGNRLRQDWARLLGEIEPKADPVVRRSVRDAEVLPGIIVDRIQLATEPGILVPLLVLLPPHEPKDRLPIVVAVAQGGKEAFLRQRAATIGALLKNQAAVCLLDVRGTGETSPGEARGRRSAATSISATNLMLGQTLLGARLRDLRAVLRHLRGRADLDGKRVALWGDSFALPNPPDCKLQVPRGAENRPGQSEPLGGLLALLAALYEDDVRAVLVRGGLDGYQSVLQSQFCYLPHDVAVPGVLTVGDLADVAAALAPRRVRLEGLVNGLNRAVDLESMRKTFEPARQAYHSDGSADGLILDPKLSEATQIARWLCGEP